MSYTLQAPLHDHNREPVCSWLTDNGLDPHTIRAITVLDESGWVEVEEYIRDQDGNFIICDRDVATRIRKARVATPPPIDPE